MKSKDLKVAEVDKHYIIAVWPGLLMCNMYTSLNSKSEKNEKDLALVSLSTITKEELNVSRAEEQHIKSMVDVPSKKRPQ